MSITKNSDDYDESYMKVKFNLNYRIPTMTVIVRAVFHENNKYHPHVFLDECLYQI